MIKINWVYEGDAGYWVSSEGRFNISPEGFRHNVTPDYYEISDQFEYFKARIANPAGNLNLNNKRFDTVRECKAYAVKLINS